MKTRNSIHSQRSFQDFGRILIGGAICLFLASLTVLSSRAANSRLQIVGGFSNGCLKLEWEGANEQAWQLLEYRETLASTLDPWVTIFAGKPENPVTNYFLDVRPTNGTRFYRIKETSDISLPWSVDAGRDLSVTLPGEANLVGSVTNGSLTNGTLTVGWSVLSGPGSVNFSNARVQDTTASFSSEGTYVLRLSCSDGSLTVADHVRVIVEGPFNPVVTIDNPLPWQAYLLPTQVSFGANLTGNTGEVVYVEFLVNGSSIGTDSDAPYNIVWSNVVKGTHQLTARAFSTSARTADSAAVNIDVYDATNLPCRVRSVGGPPGSCLLSVGADRNRSVLYYGSGRGFNALVVHPGILRDDVAEKNRFDTYASRNSGSAHWSLVDYLDRVPDGSIILLGVRDEAGLNEFDSCTSLRYSWVSALQNKLEELGSGRIRSYCYRDAFGLIGVKGSGLRGEGLGRGEPVDSADSTNWIVYPPQ
jgi:hypothetical protein